MMQNLRQRKLKPLLINAGGVIAMKLQEFTEANGLTNKVFLIGLGRNSGNDVPSNYVFEYVDDEKKTKAAIKWQLDYTDISTPDILKVKLDKIFVEFLQKIEATKPQEVTK